MFVGEFITTFTILRSNTVSSSAVFIKVSLEYGKKGIVAFSGNGKEPHVSLSVIGPFLPVLLAGARARLLFCAKAVSYTHLTLPTIYSV